MVLYTCEKCGKTFKQKSNYVTHTTMKKIPCDILLKPRLESKQPPQTSYKNSFINYNNENTLIKQTNEDEEIDNISNISSNTLLKSENNKKNTIIDDIQTKNINTKNINELSCKYCNIEFTRKDNLTRHYKVCKDKKYQEKYDLLKKEFDILKTNQEKLMDLLLKKESEEVTKKQITNNNTNNTNNNSNNSNTNTNNGQINSNNQTNSNNINIFQFGKEDYSKIPDSIILKAIMSSTGAGIPCNIIEKLHFNNDFPEFKNICITDKNRKHALFWNGNKWIRRKYENLGTDMLDRCLYLISDRMDFLEKLVVDKKTFGIKKKALDKLENVNSDDEAEDTDEDEKITIKKATDRQKFRKHASDIIENLLYDNRDLILQIN